MTLILIKMAQAHLFLSLFSCLLENKSYLFKYKSLREAERSIAMVFYSIILLFLLCKINETCERDLGSDC